MNRRARLFGRVSTDLRRPGGESLAGHGGEGMPRGYDRVGLRYRRIQALLPTFPPQVMSAWNSTMSLKTVGTPDGALPIPQTPRSEERRVGKEC